MYRYELRQGKQNFEDSRAIRTAVFVKEQGVHDEFDDKDAIAWHIVVLDGDKPIATGRTFAQDATTYMLGRIAVLKEYRGTGAGALIIQGLEEKLRELGAVHAKLSAQLHAVGFYEAMGYSSYGNKYMDEHCAHIGMQKDL